MPLKISRLKQVTVADEDSNVIKEVKSLIYGNLAARCVVVIQSFNISLYVIYKISCFGNLLVQ